MRAVFIRFLVFALFAICGCARVDYIGKTFPVSSAPVLWYESRSELPAGRYAVIGKAVVVTGNTPEEFYDACEDLRRDAADRGAEAVCFAGSETYTDFGLLYRENDFQRFGSSESPYAPAKHERISPSVTEREYASAKEVGNIPSGVYRNERKVVRALYLKDRDKVQEALAAEDVFSFADDPPPETHPAGAAGNSADENAVDAGSGLISGE